MIGKSAITVFQSLQREGAERWRDLAHPHRNPEGRADEPECAYARTNPGAPGAPPSLALHRLASRRFEAAAGEQGAVETVEVDQCLAVLDLGADDIELG